MTLPLTGAGQSGAGGFTPLSLSPSLWLKPESLALADAAAVATWPDSSGNARDATQATGGLQPTFRTNQINGLSVVRFDGTDDFLQTAVFASTQPATAFAVYRPTGTPGSTRAIVGGRSAFITLGHSSSGLAIANAGLQVSGDFLNAATAYVLRATFNGASSAVAVNGAAVVSGDASTNAFGGVMIGGWGGSGATPPGDIAEVLLFPSVLAAGDITAVKAYLGTKYGIVVV